MKKFLLLVMLMSSVSYAYEPQAPECDFYLEESAARQCSEDDYLIAFGHKYCEKFTANAYKFTPNGRRWLAEARECLINDIIAMPDNYSCAEVEEGAYASHQHCYLDAGYCELSLWDVTQALNVIGTGIFYQKILTGLLQVQLECIRRGLGGNAVML